MIAGMHCLGAVAGGLASPGGLGNNNGNVISVVRALGVLVCEGRIQGSPRGYKEGQHCVPPLQASPNNHVCEKDNYLCDRYLILVPEITERLNSTSLLCIEVVLCSDCPCGMIKSKSKHRVTSTVSAANSTWPNSSELLLEYWCIGVVSSKSPETMMNPYGLFQAVRSRLHFSQVAAWWSKSNGTNPSYVATRLVPYNEENLKKFREKPSEHTFPLASVSDGNSIKVTMWALPRMDEVPQLTCPLHHVDPPSEILSEEVVPEIISPLLSPNNIIMHHSTAMTMANNAPSDVKAQNQHNSTNQQQQSSDYVLYMSNFRADTIITPPEPIDDRLLSPCDQPGKHHCLCGEDEVEVASPIKINNLSLPTTHHPHHVPGNIGERKRRRSLPCRAADSITTTNSPPLDGLERSFRTQLHIESQQIQLISNNSNNQTQQNQPIEEKRYKRSKESSLPSTTTTTTTMASKESKRAIRCTLNRNKLTPLNFAGVHQSSKKLVASKSVDQCPENPTNVDWIARVPGRMLGNTETRNCSLELSQREFDEVLAVLRTRTPLRASHSPVSYQPGKRKERTESSPAKLQHVENLVVPSVNNSNNNNNNNNLLVGNNNNVESNSKADVLLGAILRSSCSASENKEQNLDEIGKAIKCSYPITSESEISQLPTVLNKKFNRLRQYFKGDQEINTGLAHLKQNDTKIRKKLLLDKCPLKKDYVFDEEQKGTSGINSAQLKNPTDVSKFHNYSTKDCKNLVDEIEFYQKKREGGLVKLYDNEEDEDDGDDEDEDDEGEESIFQNNHTEIECGNGIVEEVDDDVEIDKTTVPTVKDQQRFRRSLENAASMVFHSRTGLPLTSSPAPLRRGHCCFDFDSSLNSVSSKRSALFDLNTPPSPGAVSLEECDKETENVCDIEENRRRRSNSRNRAQSHALLGSFEESALNGRLEPVSTVHGFAAEVGASGSFCPKHQNLPVTVFFYTLGDSNKMSSPYLAHINLGKKGYQVPRKGNIQVTLLNPLGTVVKMFVVLYDLSDMPPRSHTFLRQRTLRDKALRYLIHLRFMSGKSGRIYLHTDIRMIICRKSDVDTASDFGLEPAKELRSYIHGPTNPKFSPRC